MKSVIFLTIINFLLISCNHNNSYSGESNDPAAVIASHNCDYMTVINYELKNLTAGNYQIMNLKVSNITDQKENSTNIWFAINAEVLFEDSTRYTEYVFFFDRNCKIQTSFNINESLDYKGLHLRVP